MEPAREENSRQPPSLARYVCVSVIVGFFCVLFLIIGSVLLAKYIGATSTSAHSDEHFCPINCKLQGYDKAEASALEYGQSVWDVTKQHYSDDEKEEEATCCPDVGCFSNGYPFAEFPLPECINISQISYTLFTAHDDPDGAPIELGETLPEEYSPSHQTVVIIHGYLSSGNSTWIRRLKAALLTSHPEEELNVIVLDWRYYASQLIYSQAASNVRALGAYTAVMLQQLADKSGANYTRMWCIGHSLGAHMCGHAGLRTPEQIGRITGLDPAGPCFECQPSVSVGLHEACARLVEVIHTDTRGRLGQFGTRRPLGHVDFYPNGLGNQPGCKTRRKRRRRRRRNTDATSLSCSHSRAYKLFTEAIQQKETCKSVAKCEDVDDMPASCNNCTVEADCAVLGFNKPLSQRGMYYMDTQATPPYCTG